jgi:hypothetical protein
MAPASKFPGAISATWRSRLTVAGVTCLLALHWALGVSAQIGKTVAYDEAAHLVAGYSYLHHGDYRLHTENGNLPQRWGALPLLFADPQPRLVPADDELLWHNSHVWGIAHRFLFQSGNNTDALLLASRATMAFWSIATGLLVFLWSRRLWGEAPGWFSLGLFSISPTLLAHGPLVTSDVCAAFWLLAAAGSGWRMMQHVTPGRILLSAGAVGLAAVAKYSAVLLLPIFAILAVWRALSTRPLTVSLGREREFQSFSERLPVLAAALFTTGIGAWAVIWTFFGWRYSAFAPGLPEGWKFYIPWEELLPAAGIWRLPIEFARQWHLLPAAYIEGFAHLNYQGSARSAFLLGQYSNSGWWWFFPYAFLAKSTLAEIGLTALAALECIRRLLRSDTGARWPRLERVAPLLAFAAVYGAFAIWSPLNIGHRHILPLYPVLFIFGGILVAGTSPIWLRRVAPAIALLGIVEMAAVRPNYLAFFNRAVGGPDNGWRQLVDSSLDWGQDLPALATWLRENRLPGEEAYVSYFGNGDLAYEGIEAHELAGVYAINRTLAWTELGPGVYAISATMLQAVYNPFRGPWTLEREQAYRSLREAIATPPADEAERAERSALLKSLDDLRFARLSFYLRERRPDAVIGHAMFIFRLGPDEIAGAVDGSLTDLAEAMERAAAR